MSLFNTLSSVGQRMVERAEREQDRVRTQYNSGYTSAKGLSDDELKDRYKRIDKKNPTAGDYGVAQAARERFGKK